MDSKQPIDLESLEENVRASARDERNHRSMANRTDGKWSEFWCIVEHGTSQRIRPRLSTQDIWRSRAAAKGALTKTFLYFFCYQKNVLNGATGLTPNYKQAQALLQKLAKEWAEQNFEVITLQAWKDRKQNNI